MSMPNEAVIASVSLALEPDLAATSGQTFIRICYRNHANTDFKAVCGAFLDKLSKPDKIYCVPLYFFFLYKNSNIQLHYNTLEIQSVLM